MSEDRRAKLDDLIKRRDRLRADANRLQGRLESARADLAAVEEECRKKGVAPEKLEAAIAELTRRHDASVTSITARIEVSEQALTPFLGERP